MQCGLIRWILFATKFDRNRKQGRNLKKFGVRLLDFIIIINNDNNSAQIISDYFFTFSGLLNSLRYFNLFTETDNILLEWSIRGYPCDYLRHCVPFLYSLHTERSMIMSLIDSSTLQMSRLTAPPFSNIYIYIYVGSVCPDFIHGYYGFTQLAIQLFES